MINIETRFSGNLEGALDKFEASIQGQVLISGVAAMARVIYDEVKLNASPPRLGLKTGKLFNAIYRVYSPELSSDTVKYYKVSVNKSKAPHWHLLEYGTSRAPAHPFIRPAFNRMSDAITAGQVRMQERIGNLGEIEISS
jgi:HK97 gp10 family phage protein